MASIVRLGARRAASTVSFSRSFSVSALSRKDLVQDLFINQLKSYKPTAQTKDAHAGVVKTYSAPKAPQAPSLPSDLAAELSKFDAEEPTLGTTSTAPTTSVSEEGAEGAQEYLSFLEKDLPKHDAHH